MSRIVGQNAAVQAAVRRHYYQQPRSSRIIAPPIPPIIEVTLVAYTVETSHVWHLPGDHHDP